MLWLFASSSLNEVLVSTNEPPARWMSRFFEETPDASLEEVQLVTAALAVLPKTPELARPVLREVARHR
jgi:hypothetical protein